MALGSTKRSIIAGSAAQRQTGGAGVRQPGRTSMAPIVLGLQRGGVLGSLALIREGFIDDRKVREGIVGGGQSCARCKLPETV